MKKKLPESNRIVLTYSQDRILKSIQGISSTIQNGFRRNRPLSLEITYPNVLDNPIFNKRIIIAKAQVEKDVIPSELDIPDLVDLIETVLPWTGRITFMTASRQFRNKNVLMANVEIVVEFDGMLYLMRDEVIHNTIQRAGIEESTPRIYARRIEEGETVEIVSLPHSPEEAHAVCDINAPVNEKLITYMASHGFIYKDGRFEASHTDKDTGMLVYDRIIPIRYGSVITLPGRDHKAA